MTETQPVVRQRRMLHKEIEMGDFCEQFGFLGRIYRGEIENRPLGIKPLQKSVFFL
jgi:hypothetical protein